MTDEYLRMKRGLAFLLFCSLVYSQDLLGEDLLAAEASLAKEPSKRVQFYSRNSTQGVKLSIAVFQEKCLRNLFREKASTPAKSSLTNCRLIAESHTSPSTT